ncbi:MAG: acyl-CoA dehydrogenase family protein [Euryarchaeota archaeon]|nr:acyl-CoA dehydrogenase family protein [Euryarchaeota archaeon]MDE2044454.1 acyl-CoA dehydrogenase family protein [Thermoplasmata archaeon]
MAIAEEATMEHGAPTIQMKFTEEQNALRETVAKFAQDEMVPVLDEMDEKEEFPVKTVQRMKDLGFFGVPVPEEYGGLGMGKVGYCIMLEELGKFDASHPAILGAHTSLGMSPLLYYGTEEQKQKFLAPAARGEKLMGFSLTEPHSGSDSGALKTEAKEEGDYWVLNGNKIFVTNGKEADQIVVMAANDANLGSNGGITAFLVEKGTKGFKVGRCEKKMGLHGTSTAELIFENCAVPKGNIIGGVGKGFYVAMTALDVGRVSLGAGSCGGIWGSLNVGLNYANNRMQFDAPIIQYQAIQFKLADMAMHLHALRTMVYQAAAFQDSIGYDPKKWSRSDRLKKSRDSAVIKCLGSEWASKAVSEALQIHGGIGYIRGTPIERAYRDARISEIFEGTNEVQRMIIAGDLIGRNGFVP